MGRLRYVSVHKLYTSEFTLVTNNCSIWPQAIRFQKRNTVATTYTFYFICCLLICFYFPIFLRGKREIQSSQTLSTKSFFLFSPNNFPYYHPNVSTSTTHERQITFYLLHINGILLMRTKTQIFRQVYSHFCPSHLESIYCSEKRKS